VEYWLEYQCFKSAWDGIVPSLTDTAMDIAEFFLAKYPTPARPYDAYLKLSYQLGTVYKTVRSLQRKRMLFCSSEGCTATVKAAIGLLYNGKVHAVEHVKRIWNLGNFPDDSVLSYLAVVGAALKRLGFTMVEAYICPAWGSAMYITSFLDGGYRGLSQRLGIPLEVLRKSYRVYAKILEPQMFHVDGVKVLLRRRLFSVDVVAAVCPRFGVCEHDFPDECELVRRTVNKANATA